MTQYDKDLVRELVRRVREEPAINLESRKTCRFCSDTSECTYHAFHGLYTVPSHIIRAVLAELKDDDG